eukprot:7152167-Alexandrium_andersonii.AAC.1
MHQEPADTSTPPALCADQGALVAWASLASSQRCATACRFLFVARLCDFTSARRVTWHRQRRAMAHSAHLDLGGGLG